MYVGKLPVSSFGMSNRLEYIVLRFFFFLSIFERANSEHDNICIPQRSNSCLLYTKKGNVWKFYILTQYGVDVEDQLAANFISSNSKCSFSQHI